MTRQLPTLSLCVGGLTPRSRLTSPCPESASRRTATRTRAESRLESFFRSALDCLDQRTRDGKPGSLRPELSHYLLVRDPFTAVLREPVPGLGH